MYAFSSHILYKYMLYVFIYVIYNFICVLIIFILIIHRFQKKRYPDNLLGQGPAPEPGGPKKHVLHPRCSAGHWGPVLEPGGPGNQAPRLHSLGSPQRRAAELTSNRLA